MDRFWAQFPILRVADPWRTWGLGVRVRGAALERGSTCDERFN